MSRGLPSGRGPARTDMCGVIGVASTRSIAERDWLAVGRDAMRHRGPDAAGEWWSGDGCVGLGHRRLAVVDLSPLAEQPMRDPDGDLTIVFNGEIYNFADLRADLIARGHRFRSQGDTEVILKAYRQWGCDCLERLDGMFAFALHDARQKRLLLARDRAGEKPLFYAINQGRLSFASELKGLMADPSLDRRVDPAALDAYLADGYVAGDLCMLAGVSKLPPAHALVFDCAGGSVRRWRYWQPPEPPLSGAATGNVDSGALLDELEVRLAAAVGRQMVADVPVGVLLSGGVDSSLVVALASRSAREVRTFTIRFPGHGRYDETEHARLIARHFGTTHVELDAGDAGVELLPLLVRQFDEPMVDSSMIPTYLLARVVRKYCTVALGGDGGDELFGGYPHHSRLLWLQRRLRHLPPGVRRNIARAAAHWLPVGMRGRKWLQHADADLDLGLPPVNACFDAVSRRRLMANAKLLGFGAEAARERQLPSDDDLLQRATRHDFRRYLAEDILVKVDRASMLNSLEIRAPFLDRAVIEFAFGQVPSSLKATSRGRKLLVKQLTQRILPPQFDRHRKQGFQVPLDSWLKAGPWREVFRDVLFDPDCRLFDRHYVDRLFAAQAAGRANGERLLALVMFELWRREYGVAI